jgi:hypothetical protein
MHRYSSIPNNAKSAPSTDNFAQTAHIVLVPSVPERVVAHWRMADHDMSLRVLLRAAVLGLLLTAAKPAAANGAQVLGYAVGQSTYEDVMTSLKERGAIPRDKGASVHAGGSMLEASGHGLGVEGLQSALMIFDTRNRLAGGLLTLHKSRYDAVVQALKEKYTFVREVRPFVGNRVAEFRASGALITVDAPHLSFEMTVLYRTPAVQASMEREAAASEAARRRLEREQF